MHSGTHKSKHSPLSSTQELNCPLPWVFMSSKRFQLWCTALVSTTVWLTIIYKHKRNFSIHLTPLTIWGGHLEKPECSLVQFCVIWLPVRALCLTETSTVSICSTLKHWLCVCVCVFVISSKLCVCIRVSICSNLNNTICVYLWVYLCWNVPLLFSH